MILTDLTLGQAGLYALLGYVIVFFGLILLMLVVIMIGKFFTTGTKKAQSSQAEKESAPAKIPTAPGAAGQLKLHNVDPKTAAMLMAIVANKMGKPINELRFLSIKEVTE